MDDPNQIVQNMKKQGLNPNQITQYLQREGFSPSQINQAMQQPTSNEYQPSSLQPSEPLPQPTQTQEPIMQQEPPQPEPIPAPIAQELPQEPVAIADYEMSNRDLQEQIEIISESVIAEKWREFLKSIGNVSAWKSNTDSQVINLQKDFKKTQTEIENLKDSILNKIDQYQESITEINAEMKALEKLFKQLLPSIKKISK
tara:strand:+ start:456 stop:1055 length:600 start_codon:yes stop_codon:yes gene_type:complete